MAVPTILDIAKMNGNDGAVGLIDETTQSLPELSGKVLTGTGPLQIPNVGAARTIKGINYKTLVLTTNPVSSFRNVNEGVASTKATYENRLVETFIANSRWTADKALAQKHEDGWAAFMAMEANAQLNATMYLLCKQFYYGRTAGDAKGYPGLLASVNSDMVTDATGSASVCSSVWMVKFGPQDVQWVFGNDGAMEPSEIREGDILDASSNPYTAYIQEMLLWAGIQVGSRFSCSRIKNLSATATHTLTDAFIYDNLATWPAGRRPDVIFMTRRSLKQLRASRTATSPTGAPAPIPTEIEGIPIALTDAIVDTETAA